ncbi:MAG: HNH endonuclease, partial [Bifidobacteriaceae bacterium]|nr:HNH endonuclease [Bifidobacteriaceae bacterium]
VEAGLRFAKSFDWKRVRSAVDQIAARIDPEADNRAAGQERDNRSVRLQPKPHGMAELTAYGPAIDLRLVVASIEAQARAGAARDREAGSSRTQAQREFDLLCRPWLIDAPVGELGAGFDAPATATELAARPHLLVAVEAGVLAGLSDAPARILGGDGQPLPARDAWVLAAEATWQTVLTEAGRLVAICPDLHEPATWPVHVAVSRGYKPSASLKYAVEVKDQACVRCGAPAARSELDHRIPYPEGPTSGLNVQILCKRCHQLKTHHGWQHTHNPDTGTTTIKTPAGHQHDIPPPLLL